MDKETYIRWSIDNFSGRNEGSYSPTFKCEDLDETKWQVLVLPKGKEDRKYVDVYLRRVDDNYKIGKISIILSVELVSEIHSYAVSSVLDFGINDIDGIKKCFKRSVLFGEKNSALLPNDKFAVLLYLRKSSLKLDTEEEFSEIIKNKFTWTIKNWKQVRYAYIDRKFTDTYESAFRIFICKSEEFDKNHILKLQMLEAKKGDLIDCRIAVLGAEDNEILERSTRHNFSDESETTSADLYILADTMYSYLEEDTLRLRCDLSLDRRKATLEDEVPEEDLVVCSYKELVKDFEDMYLTITPSDLVIKVGDKEVKCHKSILCEKSTVFEDLVNKTEEKVEACDAIHITDVDGETLEQIIFFLYSGLLIHMNQPRALRLFVAGHKYKISDLKQKCSLYLRGVFNSGSVYDILIAAHAYEDKDLKQLAIEYIVEHYCFLRPSAEYKTFLEKKPVLAATIFRKVMQS